MPPITRIFHGLSFTNVLSFRRSLSIVAEHFNVHLNLSGNCLTSLDIQTIISITQLVCTSGP